MIDGKANKRDIQEVVAPIFPNREALLPDHLDESSVIHIFGFLLEDGQLYISTPNQNSSRIIDNRNRKIKEQKIKLKRRLETVLIF